MSSPNGTPNQTTAVDRTYAAALFELADSDGQLDVIADEIEQLAALLTENADVRRLLTCRTLTADERAGVIERVFRGRVSDTLYRFLQVVSAKGRLESLAGICGAFEVLLQQKRGIIEADVYVAARLDDPEASRLAERLGAALGRQVVLHQYVEESLIGGVRIRIGDELIDGSVAAQLRQMKRQLIEEGREKARRISHVP